MNWLIISILVLIFVPLLILTLYLCIESKNWRTTNHDYELEEIIAKRSNSVVSFAFHRIKVSSLI